MRFDGNGGSAPNYEPNSFNGPKENPEYRERPGRSRNTRSLRSSSGNDDYTQAGNLFRLLKPDAQKRLIANIVGSMKTVPKAIQERQIGHFLKADRPMGAGSLRTRTEGGASSIERARAGQRLTTQYGSQTASPGVTCSGLLIWTVKTAWSPVADDLAIYRQFHMQATRTT